MENLNPRADGGRPETRQHMLDKLCDGFNRGAGNFLGETVSEARMAVHERAIEQHEDDDTKVGNPRFEGFDDSLAERQRFVTQGGEKHDGAHKFEQEEILEHQKMKRGKKHGGNRLAAQHQVKRDQQKEKNDEEVRVHITHPLLVEAWIQQNEQRKEEGG